MYTVYAKNHALTINFEETYLDLDLALFTYDTAKKCEDCASVDLMDALTGEILKNWDYRKGEWISPSFEK